MSPVLFTRQQDFGVEEVPVDEDRGWWDSPTAIIVKWSILGAIVLFMFLWFVGGYIHARMRIKKGLTPLRYHRFLAPEQYRPAPPPPNQNTFAFYRMDDQGYNVEQGPQGNAPMPQAYQGDQKVDPNQAYDVPPPGPPPGHEAKTNKAGGLFNKVNPFHK